MGTFKKEISRHTQKEFMGKIYTQWSEIIIYLSVKLNIQAVLHLKKATLVKEKAPISLHLRSL